MSPVTVALQVQDNSTADWQTVATGVDTYQLIDLPSATMAIARHRQYRLLATWTDNLGVAQAAYSSEFSREASLRGLQSGTYHVTLNSLLAQAKQSPAFEPGWLFKRRINGTPCPRCLDAGGRATDSNCPICYGTGQYCGYLAPRSCVYVDFTPRPIDLETDNVQGRTVGTLVTRGRIIPASLVDDQDLWVSAVNDDRYTLRDVEPTSTVAGSVLAASAKFELLRPASILYTLATPAMP